MAMTKWIKDLNGFWRAIPNPHLECIVCGEKIANSTRRINPMLVCNKCKANLMKKPQLDEFSARLFTLGPLKPILKTKHIKRD
jgi:predicted nucleic acid-binding Zn ribbon protein